MRILFYWYERNVTIGAVGSHKNAGYDMQAMEILLVEDNAGDAVFIRQILADAAVLVNLHIVRDGEQALTLLSDAHFKPTLIILDLNIPRITGTALLERWKSQDIPVVVFSSSLNDSERARVLELGAREFIQKPTDIDAFTAVVNGIVERYAGPDNKAGGACA
jgi:DNA-binding response OmpR family regulator